MSGTTKSGNDTDELFSSSLTSAAGGSVADSAEASFIGSVVSFSSTTMSSGGVSTAGGDGTVSLVTGAVAIGSAGAAVFSSAAALVSVVSFATGNCNSLRSALPVLELDPEHPVINKVPTSRMLAHCCLKRRVGKSESAAAFEDNFDGEKIISWNDVNSSVLRGKFSGDACRECNCLISYWITASQSRVYMGLSC